MAPSVKLFGDWAKASKICNTMADRFKKATEQAIMKEAHYLRGLMVKNITSGGKLAEKPFAPLAPNTLIIRRFRGFGGSKPLMVTGALRNSIGVVKTGGGVFVGVRRASRSGANIGAVHEFGATITMQMTPKMRRFLAAAFRHSGQPFGNKGGGAKGVIVIKIPARPYIQPVIDKFAQKDAVKNRFWSHVARAMGYDLGSP